MAKRLEYEPLSRDEVARVVEGRGCASRIPILLHQWISPEAFDDPVTRNWVTELLDRFPQDAIVIPWKDIDPYIAPEDDPEYRWMNTDAPPSHDENGAIDARAPLSDWQQLDGVIAAFPSADYPSLFPNIPPDDGRYRIAQWWWTLFERHWSLRGMSNALMDYYTNPDEVQRLFTVLTDFYCHVIERARHETKADAIYVTDDFGTQSGPFFSPEIFDTFFAPYYRCLIDTAHANGMHFWLHSCGDISLLLPKFIELGLDVLHPIQKYCMDEKKVASEYGGRLTFWAGFDVQQTIPFGTPEDVRREVRHLFDTYYRPDGRFLFTLGNGITGDTPLESLEALFEEAFSYGATIVGGSNKPNRQRP